MIESVGAKTFAVVGDVSDAAACERIVDEVYQHFGAIDILVNNAGTIRRAAAIEHSDEYWQTVIDTNLSSVFRLMKHAGKHMLAQGYGKIINIASMLTFQGGVFVPSYAAAKGGVGQLTKAFANEWAAQGVNVNAIAPGYMATDNTEADHGTDSRGTMGLPRGLGRRGGVSGIERQRLCAWPHHGGRWWMVEPLMRG